jgi:hypothetical protein
MPPDYHVVSLTYSVKSGDEVSYDAPPPVEVETEEAHFRLADARLTCAMKVHFSTAAEARSAVEPVLRAWELDADLWRGRGELRFQYEDAELVDRTPPVPGTVRGYVLAAEAADVLVAIATASMSVTRRTYPPPPRNFTITPDVETLWLRYQGYLEGREPLLAMAYFCLTVLDAAAGGRHEAATAYNIEYDVLRKLGELTSLRGDSHTARKMPRPAMPPLSGDEDAWIQAVIKQIIWRLGDQRSPAILPPIAMADLPRL